VRPTPRNGKHGRPGPKQPSPCRALAPAASADDSVRVQDGTSSPGSYVSNVRSCLRALHAIAAERAPHAIAAGRAFGWWW
jgi:hypothetical protein